MKDTILFGVIIFGIVMWVATYVGGIWWEWRRKKILYQTIRDGIVPADYSAAVREVATEVNDAALGGAPEDGMERYLMALRNKVALIRLSGFDVAREARLKGELFAQAIDTNPHEKGSGEAKQWARGFCQDGGHPPKGWMERA